MNAPLLRQLDGLLEIGSHTLDHVYADRTTASDWAHQVVDGKRALEDRLGHPVQGFGYPGGRRRRASRQTVANAGFVHARTTVNLHVDPGRDRLLVPTTLQLYPHRPDVLLRNYLGGRSLAVRLKALTRVLRTRSLQKRMMGLLELALVEDGVFHLWGHSWELEECGLWSALDDFLRSANALVTPTQRLTNAQVAAHLVCFPCRQ